MGVNADYLTGLIDAAEPFDQGCETLRPIQLAAINERLDERCAQIPALAHRRNELGVAAISSFAELIPLLFTYRTYRGYPDALLERQRWPMLTRWLQSLSSVEAIGEVDHAGIVDADDWLARLEAVGHYTQVNPGQDGKCAFLDQTKRDLARVSLVPSVGWSTGFKANRDMFTALLIPRYGHNVYIPAFTLMAEAFGRPGDIHFLSEEPSLVADAIRTGSLSRDILLGKAVPGAAKDMEREAARRQARHEHRFLELARMLLERRGEKVMIYGLANQHLALANAFDKLDAPDNLFHRDSLIGPGIGTAFRLPEGVVERLFRRYGVAPERSMQAYAMSEVLSQMPMCGAGRYHVPPWQPVFMVDRNGEMPLPDTGIVEGRVAIFDLLVEGRWGAFLTSDKATLDHGQCPCGRKSPTVLENISRYTDIDDDKLSCAGSIDSYIRGVIAS